MPHRYSRSIDVARGNGRELLTVQFYISNSNHYKESLAVLIAPDSLR